MAEPLIFGGERDALAAELALGLLDGQERADALRLSLRDQEFAAQVRVWEDRIAPMHDRWISSQVSPGPAVWRGIEWQIAKPQRKVPMLVELRRWKVGAFGSGAVAMLLGAFLLSQPAQIATVASGPQSVTVARISGEAGGPVIFAHYDPVSGQIRLRASGLGVGPLAPELWVIPADGKPRSLGQIDRKGQLELAVSAAHRRLMRSGATLAITMEPKSVTPHAAPSSAPVATGKIMVI